MAELLLGPGSHGGMQMIQGRRIHTLVVAGLAWAALAAFQGCASSPRSDSGPAGSSSDAELERLADWMTGSFSSAAQAERDREYFDIRLEMVEIWTDQDDAAVWLYVEQATATSIERPYRQRVYRLTRTGENEFTSAVFELPGDPLAFGGWHQTPDLFNETLGPGDLTEMTGCAVLLTFDADAQAYVGATAIGTCESTLRGADYVVSEVTVLPDRLLTWDRGFDGAGQQVWGAVSGGYEFVRIE